MFKGPQETVRDNKSSSYPVFKLPEVNCIIFLCKYVLHSYLRYTDRLLNVFTLLLAVILSELHKKTKRKG